MPVDIVTIKSPEADAIVRRSLVERPLFHVDLPRAGSPLVSVTVNRDVWGMIESLPGYDRTLLFVDDIRGIARLFDRLPLSTALAILPDLDDLLTAGDVRETLGIFEPVIEKVLMPGMWEIPDEGISAARRSIQYSLSAKRMMEVLCRKQIQVAPPGKPHILSIDDKPADLRIIRTFNSFSITKFLRGDIQPLARDPVITSFYADSYSGSMNAVGFEYETELLYGVCPTDVNSTPRCNGNGPTPESILRYPRLDTWEGVRACCDIRLARGLNPEYWYPEAWISIEHSRPVAVVVRPFGSIVCRSSAFASGYHTWRDFDTNRAGLAYVLAKKLGLPIRELP